MLKTALSHPAAVKPGDTIWLRGGTYVGVYSSYLNGTAAAPIIVRQYPGERATLDGQGLFATQTAMFFVRGSYVWFWGFEVMSSNTDRLAAASTSWPTGSDLPRPGGVEIDGNAGTLTGIKFINMLVHDTRQGFSLWSNSSDVEVYGCLVYYNGWDAPDRGHGHGIYLQNRTGRKWIRNSISFGNYGDGLQAYGSDVSYLNNFTIERSAFFDNGLPSGGYTDQLLVGGGAITRDDIITENCVYAKTATLFRLGYGAASANAIVLSNYFGGAQGGIYFTSPSAMTMRSNRFYTPNVVGISKTTYPDNTYGTGDPTVNSTFIHRNAYEPNRSHIVVYNWQNLNTVTVDASQSLAPNDRYELRNAMNYFGDVIVGTNTTAGQLVIPMSGRVIAAPMGQAAPASPFPRFGTFLLINLGPTGESQANLAPTISSISNTSIAMDSSTGPLPFTVGDTQTSASSLVVTASSSNTSLVPGANLVLGGSGANRTITVTPASGQSGTATITVSVSDGTLASSSSFTLTVTAPNTAPTISAIPSTTVDANSATPPLAFSISDSQTPANSLVLGRSSSDLLLVPLSGIVFGGTGNSRTLTVTPATGRSGAATITVSVSDGSMSSSSSFVVTVRPPNSPPTISPIQDQQLAENLSSLPIPFLVGDAETLASNLLVTALADDTSLFASGSIVIAGTGSSRTITLSPAPDRTGTTRVTIQVNDGALAAATSFEVTVVATNTPPQLSDLASIYLPVGTTSRLVTFQVSDAETAADSLVLAATSSNPTLLPAASLVLAGTGTNRSLTLAPTPLITGSSIVTLSVSDGTGSTSKEFVVTVSDANTPPTISAIPPLTLQAATTSNPIPITVRDAETAAESLLLEASSSSRTLLPTQNIKFGGTGEQRTLTITPAPGQVGSAIVYVTVGDGTYRIRTSFSLTVIEANSPPSISSLGDIDILVDSSSTLLPILVQDDRTAPESLVLDATSSNPSVVPDSGLVLSGTGNFRYLQVIPSPGALGESLVAVGVSDGSLKSTTQFTVRVFPGNTSPTISAPDSLAIEVNAASPLLEFQVGDAETEPTSLLVTATSSNPALIATQGLVLGGSGTQRTLQVIPVTDQVGLATITLEVSDGASTARTTIAVEVTTAGTPPWILPIQPVQVYAGHSSAPIAVTIGDAESAATTLTLVASTSSKALIPTQNVVFGGTGEDRTLIVTPAAGVSGTVTVFITVSDGVLRARTSFKVTILAPNEPPTVGAISSVSVNLGSAPSQVPFTLSDLETAPDALLVSVSSSNPGLVDASGLVLAGAGTSRTLTITPLAGAVGTATIQVTVSDGANSVSTAFQFTVATENLPPTMVLNAPTTLFNSAPSAPIPVTLADPDTPASALFLSASTTPRTLLPTQNVVFEGTGANRFMTINPLPDLTGSVTVIITVTDGFNRVRSSVVFNLVSGQ